MYTYSYQRGNLVSTGGINNNGHGYNNNNNHNSVV